MGVKSSRVNGSGFNTSVTTGARGSRNKDLLHTRFGIEKQIKSLSASAKQAKLEVDALSEKRHPDQQKRRGKWH